MCFSDKKLTEDESGSPKRSKKKQKKEDAWRPKGTKDPFAMLNSLPENKQQEIQRALHLFSLGPSMPKTLQQAKKHIYRFWETQPVPRLDGAGGGSVTHGPIVKGESNFRKEPYSLPQGFSWDTLDLSSSTVLRELCTLLNENYMEEDDNTVRFDFSLEYLQWALQPPNWLAQWHCGVRVNTNNKLVGFIAAVPADVRIYETEKRMVQVKFLCVHKKLRLKRMTPVLIRELTRRVNQQGVYQAVYTAGIVLPTPLSSCRYWNRPLNPRKLSEVNYPGLRQTMNLQRAVKFNRLPEVTKTPGLRHMTKEDVAGIHSLLQANLCKFHLSPILSLQEVEHWLLPRENVIDTYVVEGDDGALTGVVSFYSVSSRVLNHPVHTGLRAAHLLYVASTAADPVDLMEDTLVLAKSKGFDVFSALDVMDNKSFLEKLKFSINDTSLHYYLYNWMCLNMSADKVLSTVISPTVKTHHLVSYQSRMKLFVPMSLYAMLIHFRGKYCTFYFTTFIDRFSY
ncbi:glycylpeptide N-tetradecanoyltransferase 2-like isoform X2 [Chelmon rostratus]|uniref:glycylpeptide N-tetradecanoyltransferase 2-like isoform X2 n=1 Tax=Chelmon rostratus TaxID=109905 RepID=UPI001BEC78E9|nr:glycylpeptide N-tetradecanoyltransferase 2-like isoform X2 [Chelmon rostratus]